MEARRPDILFRLPLCETIAVQPLLKNVPFAWDPRCIQSLIEETAILR